MNYIKYFISGICVGFGTIGLLHLMPLESAEGIALIGDSIFFVNILFTIGYIINVAGVRSWDVFFLSMPISPTKLVLLEVWGWSRKLLCLWVGIVGVVGFLAGDGGPTRFFLNLVVGMALGILLLALAGFFRKAFLRSSAVIALFLGFCILGIGLTAQDDRFNYQRGDGWIAFLNPFFLPLGEIAALEIRPIVFWVLLTCGWTGVLLFLSTFLARRN